MKGSPLGKTLAAVVETDSIRACRGCSVLAAFCAAETIGLVAIVPATMAARMNAYDPSLASLNTLAVLLLGFVLLGFGAIARSEARRILRLSLERVKHADSGHDEDLPKAA